MSDTLKQFTIKDPFWGRYKDLVCDKVIPYQEKILNDELPNVEKSHALENFRQAAQVNQTGKCSDEFYGMVFQDSDVAKWLEAASYSLINKPNPDLIKRCDAIIEILAKAQLSDGYLDSYFTVKDISKRWTDLQEAHELYCMGHMIEAGIAYAQATNKTSLLDIVCKIADHIYTHFITEKAEGYPGHPEIELALMRLYHYTKNEKYQELALHFINVRGVDPEYFTKECNKRGWNVWGSYSGNKEYYLCHEPVLAQKDAVGHAVRAVYLYTGMADAANSTNNESLKNACKTLWDSIEHKRMYVTGAIGSAYEGECFTEDYHLPNDTCYGETCASVGLIFFANQMLKMEKNSKYADVMERALYNCVLAGMQLDGTKFYYVNPLESVKGISGIALSQKHALPQRPQWFACACCPPNVARLITSLGRYAWNIQDDTVYSILYVGGSLTLPNTSNEEKIICSTDYPYNGNVEYSFELKNNNINMTLAIRLPFWSKKTIIKKNGKKTEYEIKDGFAYLKGPFTNSDKITCSFDMEIKKIYASTNISSDSGKVAFSRGPFIYCLEGIDNNNDALNLFVDKKAKPKLLPFERQTLYGINKISVKGIKITTNDLYSFEKPKEEACTITLIPYYTWANREQSTMRVWIPQK